MSDSRDMRRTGDDDLLAEIGAGLAVEPSMEFSEGVRRRIAGGASGARFFGVGWWQAAGVAAGLAVAVTLAMQFGTAGSRPAREPKRAPFHPIATRVAESAPVSVAPGVTTTPARIAVSPSPRVSAVRRPGQASTVAASDRREVRSAGPDLTVLTNQPALLRRMWAGRAGGGVESVDAGRASASPSARVDSEISITELTVAPIVIPDVTVQTAPVSGAGGAGGAGVRRVISAEQSARSRE